MSLPIISIEGIDEGQLLSLIDSANERLVFLAPGVSLAVANAIIERWQVLGPEQVKIILDVDPEIIRLGYGDISALENLRIAAEKIGASVNHQPGLRIGLIVSDQSTHVFAPTPLLIDAGSFNNLHLNSILLDFAPPSLLRELGFGKKGAAGQTIGKDEISSGQTAKVTQDLARNPPMKFDIARSMRVFNAHFEFVEFELRGTQLASKTIAIPNDLMGFAQDEKVQKLLHTNFQLISKDGPLSDASLKQHKDYLAGKYLTLLPNYGSVILRRDKEKFLQEVEKLKIKIKEYQQFVEESLQAEMDKNRTDLMLALLPAVQRQPPARWIPPLGFQMDEKEIAHKLDRELQKAFGSASKLISRMQVKVISKGVTYELLNDKKFLETAQKELPTLKKLYDEFLVAQQK